MTPSWERSGDHVDRRISEVTRSPAKPELPGPPQLGPPESYFYGVWIDATEDEPREYYDELDASRWSIRCVRKYRDGRYEAYSYASDNWRDVMPEAPIPRLADIDAQENVSAKEISKAEFDVVWDQANRSPAT
jgi:hypothetical protein